MLLVALCPLAEQLASKLPACLIKSWSGMPCLACGTTRAGLALSRLDVAGAFSINPLAALSWITLIGGGLAAGLLALLNVPLREPDLNLSLPVRCLLVTICLANWVYLVGAGT